VNSFEDQLAGALRAHAATLASDAPATASPPAGPAPRAHGADVAPRRARRRRWPLLVLPAAGVAAVALLLVAPSERATPPASAAALLRSAATAAEREAPLAPGQRLYIRERYRGRIGTGVEERWLRADGSGRVVRREGGLVVEEGRTHTPITIAAARAQAERDIPRDPGFDAAELRAYRTYRVLHEVLESAAPGPVRATAYRELASVPGLRVLQRSDDRVLLAARVGDVEFRARIDTGEGRVLALERVLLRRSRQIPGPPRVVDRTVFERQDVIRP
jgi:hypothetical protein